MRKTCNPETRVGRQAPAFLITLSTQHALVFWFPLLQKHYQRLFVKENHPEKSPFQQSH